MAIRGQTEPYWVSYRVFLFCFVFLVLVTWPGYLNRLELSGVGHFVFRCVSRFSFIGLGHVAKKRKEKKRKMFPILFFFHIIGKRPINHRRVIDTARILFFLESQKRKKRNNPLANPVAERWTTGNNLDNVSPDFTGFYWVQVSYSGFLLGFYGFYWVLPSFYLDLPRFT